MAYQLVYTRRAVKDIQQLDGKAKERIKTALEKYCDDPFAVAQKLMNPKLGTYRFRIGDYRVIFDVEGEKLIILRVGHRRDIYRAV